MVIKFTYAVHQFENSFRSMLDARLRELYDIGYDASEWDDDDLDEGQKEAAAWLKKHRFDSVEEMKTDMLKTLFRSDEIGMSVQDMLNHYNVGVYYETIDGFDIPTFYVTASVNFGNEGHYYEVDGEVNGCFSAIELSTPVSQKCLESLDEEYQADIRRADAMDRDSDEYDEETERMVSSTSYYVEITAHCDGSITYEEYGH